MYCLRSLGNRDRGFESNSGHGYLICVCAFFCVCVVLCLGRGLTTSCLPVQGVLPSVNDHETEKSAPCSKVGANRKEKKLWSIHYATFRQAASHNALFSATLKLYVHALKWQTSSRPCCDGDGSMKDSEQNYAKNSYSLVSVNFFVNPQNYRVFGLYPSSGILNIWITHRFGNWICFRPQVKGRHLLCWVP
jgi:hypothetical protein